ncbi:MAG: replicative DNA helicase [Gemmataceae bacterium]
MNYQVLDSTEQALLGGLLRNETRIDDVATIVRAEDFRTYHHQRIFEAVVALWDDGKPVDAAAVADELYNRNQIEDIGGYQYLAQLLEQQPTVAGVVAHARRVRERAVIRSLNFAAKEIVAATEHGKGNAAKLLEEAEQKIFGIAEGGFSGKSVRLDDAMARFFDLIDARARRGGRLAGLPTGFPDLDELTGGLNDGEMTILAARTSVGKTSLALQIARAAAVEYQAPALFVSLEMSEAEITQRVLCGAADVDGQRLRNGCPSREDIERLTACRAKVKGAPLFIDDTPSQRMIRIAATARRRKRQDGLRLVVVDYLQLVEPDDRKAARHEQVSAVSRRLKALAKELSVPVLALAQLNRQAEDSSRPKLHHLRESGSLEQDADTVLLMHRLEDSPSVIEVEVAKNRNGPTGTIKLVFDRRYTRFGSYAAGPPFGG